MGESSRSIISSVILRASLATLLLAVLAACSTPSNPNPQPQAPTDVQDASAPDGFGYETTGNYDLSVTATDLFSNPIANAVVTVYHSHDLESNDKGQEILRALTNGQGNLETVVTLPSYIESLLVSIDAFGIPNIQEVTVDSRIEVTFAPSQGERPNVNTSSLTVEGLLSTQADTYRTLGTWGAYGGWPNYMLPNEFPSQRIIELIQTSLPEEQSVLEHHPNFLSDNATTDLIFSEASEVWVSFLHEGAGHKNTLGYFTYDPANPPSSQKDIDDLTIIFPNSSFHGGYSGHEVNQYTVGGGWLWAGDKVKLVYDKGGSNESSFFPADTALGWFIIGDGWQGDVNTAGYIDSSKPHYYSHPSFNPDNAQHLVLLFDEEEKLFLLGAEDLDRVDPSKNIINGTEWVSDDDFNDIVFKIEVSDIASVKSSNIANADDGKPKDSDEDGVQDKDDHYPNDPSKAFNTYYPNQDGYNTLAYEDRWPLEGDYDFNDLVVDYRINQIVNAKNQVVELDAEFKFRAAGAAYTNAFAFELPLSSEAVASVEGAHFVDPNGIYNYIKRNANGTEAGQDNAVIFVSDDLGSLLGHLVNTEESSIKTETKTVKLNVKFTNPQEQTKLLPPYNPFIVTNVDGLVLAATGEERATRRGNEVHLPNHAPTQLADKSLFNTKDDSSNAEKGQWYVTKGNNLPWALHIPASFDYPVENAEVSESYKHFVSWVNSGGEKYGDWYTDQAGYRNTDFIY